jgi:RNA polymerase sigma-70 factor, ECF subfamily
MSSGRGEITVLLSAIRSGDDRAASQLIPLVYDELHRLAAGYMRKERPDHTLQATALVHEAYVRLIGDQNVDWKDRAHFLGVAATVMRRILVEWARARNSAKRGGLRQKVNLDDDSVATLARQIVEVIDLDAALERLSKLDPRLSRTVELRYFGGLTIEETAEVLGLSSKTVKRDWDIAKAWLRDAMSDPNRRES